KHLHSKTTFFPETECIPLDGAIKKSQHTLLHDDNHIGRINRINYEICVFKNLRDKLRTKEVWIRNAFLYRNPEEDLPQDFEENRNHYYQALNKTQDEKTFVKELKSEMTKHLRMFNLSIKNNKQVQILKKPHGRIKIEKPVAQTPPEQLEKIKQEVLKRWPSTSLLDVLKEADMCIDFLSQFVASGPKEGLSKNEIRKRLLLAILGYGTNTGLKSVSVGNKDINYNDLRQIRLRYLDPDNLRKAIMSVVNSLLKIRAPKIWGESTTAVASDSTHFHASDQNLMSQWHPRYKDKGIMVYWHVDTKSLCIYSQLKSCSSSEVASMMEGVLRHCTEMNVGKNYVDTHGASEVGFAFAHMLNFDLLPRFKNIHAQKLYLPEPGSADQYSNLEPILSRSIKWELIESQYDQIVKYTTALRLGTADSETILKRFTRNNIQHPTYKALAELGKAIKTIFLCRYLSSKALRQEIHEGLNVVERWNGINDFIFYGKVGSFRTNNPEEAELSMLCLHLLQISMVYINTLMLQQVIHESHWLPRLTLEDKRAITPLLHKHINPYGLFLLDLSTRLPINHSTFIEAA
ncbi:MAG: Tn3 family transposase, partial [Candidatus Cloacimonetes bacterium]|nr:Tn3 family transposase [Candidatus Cloacimonadota bacterium]